VVTQGFIDGAIDPTVADYKRAFLEHIDRYKNIGRDELRANLAFFLKEVIPVAEEAGVNLAIHPDDPPFSVLGLPRIFSTADDLEWLQNICPSLNNGVAFCAGSFSARRDNDLVEMTKKYGHRFHFVHLRNTKVLADGSFYESGHIEGGVNMVQLVETLIDEMQHRKESGRPDFRIPMRPDHGIKILNDFNLNGNSGYPLIGRLKGLAEIAGLEEAILQMR
jgi:mannonate dehydratase